MFGIDSGIIQTCQTGFIIYSAFLCKTHTLSLILGATLDHSFLGGSLQAAISENTRSDNHFEEPELKDILLQISLGLKYIHNAGMVHLDIKPSQYNPLCPSKCIQFFPLSCQNPCLSISVKDVVSWRVLFFHLFPLNKFN